MNDDDGAEARAGKERKETWLQCGHDVGAESHLERSLKEALYIILYYYILEQLSFFLDTRTWMGMGVKSNISINLIINHHRCRERFRDIHTFWCSLSRSEHITFFSNTSTSCKAIKICIIYICLTHTFGRDQSARLHLGTKY